MNSDNKAKPTKRKPATSPANPAIKVKINPTGKWRITEMEQWDADYIDMEEPGYIAFKSKGAGDLRFGCIQAQLDWRLDPEVGRIEFSFSGFDEDTEIDGRGWVKVNGKQMIGRIFIHMGDESGFKAERSQ